MCFVLILIVHDGALKPRESTNLKVQWFTFGISSRRDDVVQSSVCVPNSKGQDRKSKTIS
eukprot:2167566-Amphidinium_carterae.1